MEDIRFTCILCWPNDRDNRRTLSDLARHVKRRHSIQARQAYKQGYWDIKDNKVMNNEPNMFDSVDIAPQPIVGEQAKVEVPPKGEVMAEAATSNASPSIVKVIGELEPPSFIEPKADCIVGATGSGKTINIGEVAKYILAKTGKLTRLASTDPAGAGPLSGMVKSGEIKFWAPQAWPRPIEAMYKSTLGYWPLREDDPESPIVPPDAGTFEVYGFGAFEGLTSYGDTILDDLKRSKASLSQDPSFSWSQGDFTTSGGNQSYYGMMQDTLKLWVVNTHLLPYEKVLWTALESKGDDQSGSKVYGPMIGGKKATGKAGQWFVNLVHMDIIAGPATTDKVTGQSMVEAKHILFLKTHIDPLTMVPFPCKVRVPKEYVKEVPSYLESGDLAEVYRLLDKLYAKQQVDSDKRMNEIAGLRDKLLERAAAKVKAEAEAAEKRAKAAKLLKPMVTVVGSTTSSVPAIPTSPPTKQGNSGPTGGVVGAGPSSPPSNPVSMPAKPKGPVSIQPAGKK